MGDEQLEDPYSARLNSTARRPNSAVQRCGSSSGHAVLGAPAGEKAGRSQLRSRGLIASPGRGRTDGRAWRTSVSA